MSDTVVRLEYSVVNICCINRVLLLVPWFICHCWYRNDIL